MISLPKCIKLIDELDELNKQDEVDKVFGMFSDLFTTLLLISGMKTSSTLGLSSA